MGVAGWDAVGVSVSESDESCAVVTQSWRLRRCATIIFCLRWADAEGEDGEGPVIGDPLSLPMPGDNDCFFIGVAFLPRRCRYCCSTLESLVLPAEKQGKGVTDKPPANLRHGQERVAKVEWSFQEKNVAKRELSEKGAR